MMEVIVIVVSDNVDCYDNDPGDNYFEFMIMIIVILFSF